MNTNNIIKYNIAFAMGVVVDARRRRRARDKAHTFVRAARVSSIRNNTSGHS